MLVRLAMCLVPRPSLLEREMMIRNCIEVAVLVGPEQTQANILSPVRLYCCLYFRTREMKNLDSQIMVV